MGTASAPPVRFRWGRRELRAPAGTPLAAAVTEGTPPILQRSIRYHRPRAPFCGTGACTNCLVRVNGVPNVRACRYAPANGDRIESENAWPSPRLDVLGAIDRLFPSGLDAVHGFRRPAFARPLYQWFVRRLAAFGSLPGPAPAPALPPARTLDAGWVIVGAGPAGLGAARTLVQRGQSPVLLDRQPSPPAVDGAVVVGRTTAGFLPPPRAGRRRRFDLLASGEDGTPVRIAADGVILATGAYDAGLWFANGDRPGVLTAEGAITLEGPGGAPPFRRGILFGSGPRAASMIARWGERLEALVAPGAIAPEVVRTASEHGVPMYPRSLLVRALGGRRVRGVELRGRGGGPTTRLEADAVVLAHRRLPNAQMLFQVGASMRWSARPGAYFPDQIEGATSVPGLLVAGEVAGSMDAVAAASDGARVAERALADAPWPTEFPPGPPEPPAELEGYYRELLGAARVPGRWVACACEDVLLSEILEAEHRGYRGIEVIKRYTGLGTGLCQGRYCVPEALLVLAQAEGRPPSEVGYITQRPPVH
ncbi:MAG TPA: 2Fe-2S iron-sulfur cluster-binding protein, partial [Thermoplasmata archaeon]|nr:2Fe-2S iron-sulfur cluster-binding protein [Thermoplasmata archaeon]